MSILGRDINASRLQCQSQRNGAVRIVCWSYFPRHGCARSETQRKWLVLRKNNVKRSNEMAIQHFNDHSRLDRNTSDLTSLGTSIAAIPYIHCSAWSVHH